MIVLSTRHNLDWRGTLSGWFVVVSIRDFNCVSRSGNPTLNVVSIVSQAGPGLTEMGECVQSSQEAICFRLWMWCD